MAITGQYIQKDIGRRFSVVIVNFNGEGLTLGAVHSAIAEGVREHNIIVVDNGSTDSSMQTIQAHFPLVKTYLSRSNLGFAKAANIGIRHATSEFILLLNNDAKLCPDCLSELTAAFERSSRLALAGGQLLHPDGRLQSAFAPFPTLLEEIVPRNFLRLLLPHRYRRTTRETGVRDVQSVFGACIAVRAAALPAIGLLDEDFFFYYEEVDWCRRATCLGWSVAYVPQARAHHISGHTARKFGSAARIELERSKMIYFRKILSPTKYAIFSINLTVRSGINAATCGVSALLARKRNEKLCQKAHTYRDLFRWHVSGRPQQSGLPRQVT